MTVLTRLRRLLHRPPPARVAAHHPLPPAAHSGWPRSGAQDDLAKAMYAVRSSGMRGADGLDVLKLAAAGADTETDPTTGRYTRREQ